VSARQLEGDAAGGAGDGPRRLARVAGQSDVDVVGRPPKQAVANGAADEPGLLAGQRLARSFERLSHSPSAPATRSRT
jgi:hypothetical protein